MGLQHILIKLTALFFVVALAGTTLAADKPVSQVDLEKLQEQVRSIDKDIAVLKEGTQKNLEALKDRQNDITAGQATSLAAITNQTTMLGILVAAASILIILLVFGAGYFTFKGATKNAKEEAREASKKWIDENSEALTKQIEQIEAKAARLSAAMDDRSTRFSSDADAATALLNEKVNAANLVGSQILAALQNGRDGNSSGDANQGAVHSVLDASEALKAKPEDAFTAADFYARGLADFANQNYQSALLAFENAIRRLETKAPNQQRVTYLFAKALTLGMILEFDREIGLYEEIDRSFGWDKRSDVRKVVAKGILNKVIRLSLLGRSADAAREHENLLRRFGDDFDPDVKDVVAGAFEFAGFTKISVAKERWNETSLREDNLRTAETELNSALMICGDQRRASILCDLGYAQFLRDKRADAELTTEHGLRLGGKKSLEERHADAKLHRVEPQDTDYEKMLAEIWKTIQAESLNDKKKL